MRTCQRQRVTKSIRWGLAAAGAGLTMEMIKRVMRTCRWACVGGKKGRWDRVRRWSDWGGGPEACGVGGTGQGGFGS